MKEIYLDNAAGAPIDRRVVTAMLASMKEQGNPSAFNNAGRRSRARLENARAGVARFLHAHPSEIIFCSSGSEANTLAITGVAGRSGARQHAIATAIEHLSVLEPLRSLERRGWKTSVIPVDDAGRVSGEDTTSQITPKTALVSVMYANNEVGTIQPIQKIAKAIRSWRKAHRTAYPYMHVDACQAAPWLSMDVQALGVDLLTINGSKVHGPRGSAVLFVRRGVALEAHTLGGAQEGGLRAGTEDVPAAVGIEKALSLIKKEDGKRVARLRDYAIQKLRSSVPEVRIHGASGKDRLPNNISISIPNCVSEELLLELDRYGIRAGSGSACTAHSVEPSHVLRAMRVPKRFLGGALRFSLSRQTTRADMDQLIYRLPKVITSVSARRLK